MKRLLVVLVLVGGLLAIPGAAQAHRGHYWGTLCHDYTYSTTACYRSGTLTYSGGAWWRQYKLRNRWSFYLWYSYEWCREPYSNGYVYCE